MPRTKVKLQWIENAASRKVSLRKRSKGLSNKVKDIVTLCGGAACVIIYMPGEEEPMIWPSNQEELKNVMDRYLSLPQKYSCNRIMTLESYLEGQISKLQGKSDKLEKHKKLMENNNLMHEMCRDRGREMGGMNLDELHGLAWFLKEKKKETRFYKPIDHGMFNMNNDINGM